MNPANRNKKTPFCENFHISIFTRKEFLFITLFNYFFVITVLLLTNRDIAYVMINHFPTAFLPL